MNLLNAPQIKKTLTQYFKPFMFEIDYYYSHLSATGFLFKTPEGLIIVKDIQENEKMNIDAYLKLYIWIEDCKEAEKLERIKAEKKALKDRLEAERKAQRLAGNYTEDWDGDDRIIRTIYRNHKPVYKYQDFRGRITEWNAEGWKDGNKITGEKNAN